MILVTSPPPIWLSALLGAALLVSLVLCLILTIRIRKAKKSSRGLNTSMDVVAHEIRTPLSLIKGAAELLESAGPLTDEQKQFTKTIQTNAEHAIAVAEDFLTLAKLDASGDHLSPETFDLRELTRQTARDLRAIHDFPILIRDSGQPITITADRNLIRQALWNLINNAIRHADTHSQVMVRTYSTSEHACIEVRDLGSGISPNDRDSLFVPFQQLGHEGAAATGQGAGLGLAIVDRIVALHGGELLVDSLLGRGTSIHVLLPFEQSPRRSK